MKGATEVTSEPAAVTRSAFGQGTEGSASEGSGERRLLVTGERALYLQALCEFFDTIPGLSTTLAHPGAILNDPPDPGPDVILVVCPPTDGLDGLVASLSDAFPSVPLVIFGPEPARVKSEATGPVITGSNVMAHLNTAVPLGQLAEVLSGSAVAAAARKRHDRPRLAPGGDWRLSSLSDREMSVLRLVIAGRGNDEVAQELGISRHTVRTHLQNMMAKMLVRSRTEMVSVAMRSGIRPDLLARRR